ncbi:hypothetical protein Ancab_031630 [Ancistrocladus abbreviatus]
MEKPEPTKQNQNFPTSSHQNQLAASKPKNSSDPVSEIIADGYHQLHDSKSESKGKSLDVHQCGNEEDAPENASSGSENSVAGGPEVSCKKGMQEEEESGRERLKRHRVEVAGRVWIPDIWGQEELLKDWVDCSAFDSALVTSSIMSARSALVEGGKRVNSSRLRVVQNSC